MSVPIDRAVRSVDVLTDLVITATKAEMQAAAYALAAIVRQVHPEAVQVVLEPSDQGDWLTLSGWLDEAGVQHPVEFGHWEDEVESAASHLYTAHLGSEPEDGAVPGLWCPEDRRGLTYLAQIDTILDRCAAEPVLAEALVVRDPDGGTDVQVLLLGEEVQLAEYHVDAGSGWEWSDWCEHRDDCLARASAQMRPRLVEAFDDPPGGQYVTDRDQAAWVEREV